MRNMAFDKNYIRLAQFYVDRTSRRDIIKEILRDNAVNYQIPANPNLQGMKLDLEGCTALHLALKINDREAFNRLIQNNADFTIKNSKDETVVHAAINMPIKNLKSPLEIKSSFQNYFINVVLSAHSTYNNSTNPCNKSGLSHFHVACMTDNEIAVMYFLRKGVSVTETINSDASHLPGFTPLHCAARYCSLAVAQSLLNHRAPVYCKDAKGMTPFHLLIERNMEIVDWMNMGERSSCNTLIFELKNINKFIELMLRKGTVGINYDINDEDLSYIHIASTLQNTLLVEQALEGKKVDLERSIKTDSVLWPGYTALHFAAHFSINTVKLLIKKGANMFAQDAKGITPFDLCFERHKAEDIEFLINSQRHLDYIKFSDETFLPVLCQAMKSKHMLSSFLEHIMKNVNVVISTDSPLWPGYTPLHLAVNFAARYKEINEVFSNPCRPTVIIKGDCSPNSKKVMYNCSKAEERLYLERIGLMLEAGADLTIQDLQGSTPLHHAFRLQRENVVRLLLLYHHKWPKVNPIDDDNLSHLHIACASGNYEVVAELLTECADINLSTMYDYKFKKTYHVDAEPANFFFTAGSTPLHIAIIARETNIVKLLVSSGANLYAKDAKGMTPIHRLLAYNFQYQVVEIGKFLFPEDDLKDCVTSFGLSHLHIACHVNNVKAIEKLLDAGADIIGKVQYEKPMIIDDQPIDESEEALSFLSSYQNYTPLDFAVHDYCVEAYVALLQRRGRVFNNPLNIVCCTNYHSFLENLIDIEMETISKKFFGARKLHLACFNFDVEGVRESLKNGADPNRKIPQSSRIWSGLTPLHLLVRQRNNRPVENRKLIAELLMDHGADVTLTNLDGVTPIHAIYDLQGSFEIHGKELADLLLNGHKDFSKNPTDARGFSHFHAACISNKITLVENLLKNGADVNQTIEFFCNIDAGYTPLHFAVLFKFNRIVDILLKYGANVHAQDSRGNTPLHVAVNCVDYNSKSNENIIISLIRAGAKVNAKNLSGQIPLEKIFGMSCTTTKGANKGQNKTINVQNKILEIFPKCRCFVNIFMSNGFGYIATAIKNERNIKSIMENPLYATVMKAPDINNYDEMNCTPIHNIVAIGKLKASIKVYVKAIHSFVMLGFDINHRNSEGETALHYAVKFENSKAVVALLALGADVNVTNNRIKTPFTISLDSVRNGEDRGLKILITCRILRELSKHVYKLQLANLHVNIVNQEFETILDGSFLGKTATEKCRLELERLESKKIDSCNIPLFSFLSETSTVASYPHMLLHDRQAVDNLFQNHNFHLRREFPEFAGILQMNYRKAVDRVDLIDTAKSSFELLAKTILPDLCCYYIMKFLKNNDLRNLIAMEEEFMMPSKKRRKIS